jgi:regulatory protein PHO2
MEIPFDTIIDAEFTNAAPGAGLASFLLSQPPLFYLEYASSPRAGSTAVRQWRTCPDWTEGHQASQVLRHDLIGSAVQLSHFLSNLRASARSDISLRPANSYQATSTPSTETPRPSPAVELPLPPLASLADHNLSGSGYHFNGEADLPPSLGRRDVDRKRMPYSGAGQSSPDLFHNHDRPPQSAPINGSFASLPSFCNTTQQVSSLSSPFGTHLYNNFTSEAHEAGHNGRQSSRDEFSAMCVSHDMTSRPYPMPNRSFYDEAGRRLVQPFQPRRSHSTTGLRANHPHPYNQNAPSPPLLTTPFHPPSLLGSISCGNDTGSGSPPIVWP